MQEPALDRILACVEKWKFYSRIFNTFFVNSAKIKDSQMFFAIFWPIRHCGLLISNNYGYIHDEAVDRILACVAK